MTGTPKVLVGLVSQVATFRAQYPKIVAAADRRDITFGDALLERSGVTNRRFAIAHPLLPGEITWVTSRLPAGWQLLDALPADWRATLTL